MVSMQGRTAKQNLGLYEKTDMYPECEITIVQDTENYQSKAMDRCQYRNCNWVIQIPVLDESVDISSLLGYEN